MPVNEAASYLVDVKGGIGLCPMRIDFGDGTSERLEVERENKGVHVVNHAWSKPGVYKMKARSLPGCTGESVVTVDVISGVVKSIDPGVPVKLGQSAGIIIQPARAAASGSTTATAACRTSRTPASAAWRRRCTSGASTRSRGYTVKVSGIHGCAGSAARTVEVVP